MHDKPEALALLMIARLCRLSQRPSVPVAVIWRIIVTMGPVNRKFLFTELGEDADPERVAPAFQTAVSQLAKLGYVDIVGDRVRVRPLGQDWIGASNTTEYCDVLDQFERTIPTLVAA